jgi:hypothetical protein
MQIKHLIIAALAALGLGLAAILPGMSDGQLVIPLPRARRLPGRLQAARLA